MKQRKNFKEWARSIKSCPRCNRDDLLHIGVDVFCLSCDWNNVQAYVDLGGMDNLQAAYWDSFSFPKREKNQKKSEITNAVA